MFMGSLQVNDSSRSSSGFNVHTASTRIDLSGGLGNLDVEGYQIVLTVTRGF